MDIDYFYAIYCELLLCTAYTHKKWLFRYEVGSLRLEKKMFFLFKYVYSTKFWITLFRTWNILLLRLIKNRSHYSYKKRILMNGLPMRTGCIILRVLFKCRLEVEQRRSSPKALNRESSTRRHLASRQLTQFVNLIICMRTRTTSISPLTPRRISFDAYININR